MLKIKLRGSDRDAIWVVGKHYDIGRDRSNQLVIDDDSISPNHARLVTRGNKLYLQDNHSRTGSYVNDRRVTQKQVTPGDLIRLGRIEIDVLAPRRGATVAQEGDAAHNWTLISDSSWLSGQVFGISASPTIIGRGSDCDITIPGTHLSRRHAVITVQGSRLHIRDLASANGTYINDTRIDEGVAGVGDRLRLDVYSFRIAGPQVDAPGDRSRVPPPGQRRSTGAPKQWKTRSTSPGNRIEPQRQSDNRLMAWVSVILCLTMAAAVIYLFGMI